MADEFSQYARTPNLAQSEPDEFAQYARSANTSGNPNGSNPAQAIGKDFYDSLSSFPGALTEMVTQIPGMAVESGKQIYNDPKRAMLNADLGLLEGLRGLINLPSTTFGYLGEKGVPFFKDEDVMALSKSLIRKEETDLEKYLKAQLGAGQEGDELIRGLTSFISAGGFGKTGSGLSKFAGRTGGTAAVAAGQELDPLHAAMIGTLFEGVGKGIGKVNEVVPLGPTAIGSGIAAGGHMLGIPDLVTAPIALGAGYIANKGLSPTKYAQSEVFKHLPEDRIKPVLEASERLDISPIMPAEAARTDYHGTKSGRYGKTGESSNVYQNKLDVRNERVNQVIRDFFEKISPESNKALINEGYKATDNIPLPPEKIANLAVNDPVVIDAMKDMHKDPAYQRKLKDAKPDSIKYWDIVREFISDAEQASKTSTGKSTGRSKEYKEARKDVTKVIDDVSPERAEARRLKELEHTRTELEEIFYPAGKYLGSKHLGKYLNDDKKFKKLMTNLRDVPKPGEPTLPKGHVSELQQMAQDMKLVFPNLMESQTHQTSAYGERYSTQKRRESTEVLKDILKETIGASYENAIVDLITNPNWPQIFAEYQAKNKPNLAAEMMKSMGYQLPVAGYAGQNKREER